jgi:hypothetical protein
VPKDSESEFLVFIDKNKNAFPSLSEKMASALLVLEECCHFIQKVLQVVVLDSRETFYRFPG